jgi:hypothetical protein
VTAVELNGRVQLGPDGPVVFERKDDGERVTLHLPMDLARAGRLMRVLSDEGFEFASAMVRRVELPAEGTRP